MKRRSSLFILSLLLVAFISSCASVKEHPKYDQVLVYDKPFDFTFLRTLEALNSFPGWALEETDKTKGFITLRNTEYGNLFDRDKWVVKFNVVSLGRKKTSIAIDPVSQSNVKGGDLLKRIDEFMNMSSSRGSEPSAALS